MHNKNRQCPYCRKHDKTLTREHIISKSVLQVSFGPSIRNVVRLPFGFGGRRLVDQEMVIRDVCGDCNQSLSCYDVAGVELAEAIHPYHDATGRMIPFSHNTLGWLFKTHLNHVRASPSQEFAQPTADPAIYQALHLGACVPGDLLQLFVEGWQGSEHWWAESDPRKIQYFAHKNVQIVDSAIFVSNLRIKWLDTFLLLPSDGSYLNFAARCESARLYIARAFGFKWQKVNLSEVREDSELAVVSVAPLAELIQKLSPEYPSPSPAIVLNDVNE